MSTRKWLTALPCLAALALLAGELSDWGRFREWWAVDTGFHLTRFQLLIRRVDRPVAAQLGKGDRITHVNGSVLSRRGMDRVLRDLVPGDKIVLTVESEGVARNVTVTTSRDRSSFWILALGAPLLLFMAWRAEQAPPATSLVAASAVVLLLAVWGPWFSGWDGWARQALGTAMSFAAVALPHALVSMALEKPHPIVGGWLRILMKSIALLPGFAAATLILIDTWAPANWVAMHGPSLDGAATGTTIYWFMAVNAPHWRHFYQLGFQNPHFGDKVPDYARK